MLSAPTSSVRESLNVTFGRNRSFSPLNAPQLVTGAQVVFIRLARAFSCATIRSTCPSSPLLPVWSKCVCVLMIIATGLSVTVRSWSRIAAPCPATFVSTRTAPPSAT